MRQTFLSALVWGAVLAGTARGRWPLSAQRGAGSAPATRPFAAGVEDKTPWGKPLHGLQCRLLVDPEYCVGQAIGARLEIRNVSGADVYLVHVFDIRFTRRVRATVIGPDGKQLKQSGSATCSPGPAALKPIPPGQVVRVEIPDLGVYFNRWNYQVRRAESQFDRPGTYTVTYARMAAKPPKRLAVGERQLPGGRREKIYHEFADEVLAGTFAGTLTSNAASFRVVPVGRDDLAVHEWGVFTVYSSAAHANVSRKGEWASLPDFFYRQFPARRLKFEPACWDKPVIYFHTRRQALRVRVKVTFAEGAPVVWWPCCSAPVNDLVQRRDDAPFRCLTWDLWLGDVFPAGADARLQSRCNGIGDLALREAADYPLPKECWLADARLAEAARLTVAGSPVGQRAPWGGHYETERFCFYDGLVPAPQYLTCVAAEADDVTVRSAAKFAIRDLFVVDRRAGDAAPVRFAHCRGLQPGREVAVPLRQVPPGDWPAAGLAAVGAALRAAGLTPAEADAMLKIWRKGFFDRPALTALYLLPRTEYDRMLPLAVTPQPAEVVRVGVVLHPQFQAGPAEARRIAALLGDLGAADYKSRQRATQSLLDLGPMVIPHVRRFLAAGKEIDAEVAQRCRSILAAADASEWLRRTVPARPPRTVRRR